MKNVNVGIVGLGTIGGGVYQAIRENHSLIADRTGVAVNVTGICDADRKVLESVKAEPGVLKTGDYAQLVNKDDIDIIVELIGGTGVAREAMLAAINSGKHVVTANKALLSEHWKEIFAAAEENRVYVNFEASVGGAIPIIRVLRDSLAGNRIGTIYGILNGTTNFIFTLMDEKNFTFNEALAEAQEKGIAEKDPELDISGKDSAHKLAILALLGFGVDVSPDDIYTEGISGIDPKDIDKAREWGYSVKLLAIAKDGKGGLQLRVHPALVPGSHILSGVRGEDNALFIEGDLVKETLLFGKGAGRKPTSSSVVGDIIEIARHVAFSGKANPFPFNLVYAKERNISRMEDLEIPYYLRFSVTDRPGVLAGISSVLAENGISIANVSQEKRNEGETVPVIILTHKAKEGDMRKAIEKIDKFDYVSDKTVVIRREV